MSGFDVFLSYSHEDRVVIETLAKSLSGLGLRVWFDEWILTPGTPWQRDLGEGVNQSDATAIFVGVNGVAKWQQVEMEMAFEKQVSEGLHRVIPIILPTVPAEKLNLPPILKRNTWVQLSDDMADRAILERIYWGITGRKYSAPAVEPQLSIKPPENQAISDAIGILRDSLKADNITFFLGTGASLGGATLPPSACEITRGLLLDLKLITGEYNELLPPVDVAGSYYAVRSGISGLEGRIVEMIANRSDKIPEAHQRLAKLLGRLATRPKPRIRNRVQQLIVTTNLDVMMERALLQTGVSFTRLVQHTSAARIQVNRYQNVSLVGNTIQLPTQEGSSKADLGAWDELDEIIANHGKSTVDGAGSEKADSGVLHALPVKELCGDNPILYKFRGSQDVRGSCALSVDQYLTYTRRLLRQNFVPAQITEILSSSPILLLGYGFFDPDFRLAYHGLLRPALELRQDPVYSLQLPPDQEQGDPYRRMEMQFWDRVKEATLRDLKIATLETSAEDFLDLLIASATNRSAAA